MRLDDGDLALIEIETKSELVLRMVEEIRHLREEEERLARCADDLHMETVRLREDSEEQEQLLSEEIEVLKATIKWLESRVEALSK